MYQTGIHQALNQYHNAGPLAEVSEADPHRLVQMLFEGALDRLAVARGAMLQGNTAVKGERISRAIGIIDGLRAHLDMEQGGELAANLIADAAEESYRTTLTDLPDGPFTLSIRVSDTRGNAVYRSVMVK